MSSSQQKTLEDFVELQNRNALAHAIRAAVELGVIEALRGGQKTAGQLATELEVNPDAFKRLLDVVVQSELVEKYGDDYALAPIARLIPERFYDFGDEHWKHLTFFVKTGAPLPICDELPATDRDYIVNKTSEEWMQTPTALIAAQVLDMGKSRRAARILEIGCGSAVFSATFAHSDPNSVISLLDRAVGLERAKQTIESIGLERKVTYIEADSIDNLETVPELDGETFDLVLIAGQIHRMTSGECERLFSQVYQLVKPEREFAIIDVFPGQEKGDMQRAIFQLELSLRTSRGRLHDPLAIEKRLREAGFGQIQFAHLPAAPYYWGLVLAQKG